MKISAAVSRPQTPAPAIESLELESPRTWRIASSHRRGRHLSHGSARAQRPLVAASDRAGARRRGYRGGGWRGRARVRAGRCRALEWQLAVARARTATTITRATAIRRCRGISAVSGWMVRTALSTPDGAPIHSHFFGQSSFATHSVVPERTAVKLDAGLPLETLAPLGCGVITGAGSIIESLRVGAGSSVAIFGVGGVGLSAVMAARLVGAERIVAIDTNPARLELARELGATDSLRGRYRRSGGSNPRHHGARRELHVQHHDRARRYSPRLSSASRCAASPAS